MRRAALVALVFAALAGCGNQFDSAEQALDVMRSYCEDPPSHDRAQDAIDKLMDDGDPEQLQIAGGAVAPCDLKLSVRFQQAAGG